MNAKNEFLEHVKDKDIKYVRIDLVENLQTGIHILMKNYSGEDYKAFLNIFDRNINIVNGVVLYEDNSWSYWATRNDGSGYWKLVDIQQKPTMQKAGEWIKQDTAQRKLYQALKASLIRILQERKIGRNPYLGLFESLYNRSRKGRPLIFSSPIGKGYYIADTLAEAQLIQKTSKPVYDKSGKYMGTIYYYTPIMYDSLKTEKLRNQEDK